uniref:ribosomal protein L22 n=1 Tax=Melocactus glaucescens TaxID=2775423 RepID=UPI00286A221A|nr:ribosomal protein L22 [Melocactus glaucescens]WKK45469.1 ribosomal protein L22 [Melocactus glaucescens]
MEIIKKMRQEENDESSELNGRRETYYAFGRYMRMSVHKAQRIINQIRGCSYHDAATILSFLPYKKAAHKISDVLENAVATAEYETGLDRTEFFIKKIEVNKGTKRTKSKPRARGRYDIIKRSTCQITFVIQHKFFMKDFRKKNMREFWARPNYSPVKKLQHILFKPTIRGEITYKE